MAKKQKKTTTLLDSIYDITLANVWTTEARLVMQLWRKECRREGFAVHREKLLSILRTAFDVNAITDDKIELTPKVIRRLSELNKYNIQSLTAASLLEIIDHNLGAGWDSTPQEIRDIIDMAFTVLSSKLPTSRLRMKGGSMERRLKEGYDVLEIPQGSWTEAIFAKKREPIVEEQEPEMVDVSAAEAEDVVADEYQEADLSEDDTLYSNYIEEQDMPRDDEEGDWTNEEE